MIKFWSKKKRVPIRNSNATRPWQHVLDVINGYVSLAIKIKKKVVQWQYSKNRE